MVLVSTFLLFFFCCDCFFILRYYYSSSKINKTRALSDLCVFPSFSSRCNSNKTLFSSLREKKEQEHHCVFKHILPYQYISYLLFQQYMFRYLYSVIQHIVFPKFKTHVNRKSKIHANSYAIFLKRSDIFSFNSLTKCTCIVCLKPK